MCEMTIRKPPKQSLRYRSCTTSVSSPHLNAKIAARVVTAPVAMHHYQTALVQLQNNQFPSFQGESIFQSPLNRFVKLRDGEIDKDEVEVGLCVALAVPFNSWSL